MLDSVKHILRIWVEGEFLVFEDYAFRGGGPSLLFDHLQCSPGPVLTAGV